MYEHSTKFSVLRIVVYMLTLSLKYLINLRIIQLHNVTLLFEINAANIKVN